MSRRPPEYPPSFLLWLIAGGGYHVGTPYEDWVKALLSDYSQKLATLEVPARHDLSDLHLAQALEAAIAAENGNVYRACEALLYALRETVSTLAYSRSIPYPEYLKTDHWAVKREQALERAGNACELCGGQRFLQVHHKTYQRMWNEDPNDLIVLCRACHAKFHDKLA